MILTKKQKAIAESYQKSTGFALTENEAPTDRELTDLEFVAMFQSNLDWFSMWAQECHQHAEAEFFRQFQDAIYEYREQP